jgi:hypothetical protein
VVHVVLPLPLRARSSVGERLLHTQEVAGSKPAAPTTIVQVSYLVLTVDP